MAKVLVNTLGMDRIEWLGWRSKGLGGSDASAVLGLNKYVSAVELWADKTGQLPVEDEQSEPAYWGNALEEVVAQEFTKRTGLKVRKKNQLLQHERCACMLANIDRWVVGKNEGLECKTANAYLAKEWEGDEVPASYIIQCQHYMAVTGADRWHIACLVGGQRFVHKIIERDPELIEYLEVELSRFWTEHVLANVAPVLDGSSAAEKYLKERFAQADPEKTISLYEHHESEIGKLLALKRQKDLLDKEIKGIENRIKGEMQDAVAAVGANYTVTWKNADQQRVDSKKLKELYPDVHKEVLKHVPVRKFEVKGDK